MGWSKRILWQWLIASMTVGIFVGCGGTLQPAPKDRCKVTLYNTLWQLTKIDNLPVHLKEPVTIRFSKEGKFSGFGGCNHYFGYMMVTDATMGFGPIGATRKFCKNKSGRIERKLFDFLRGTKWWQLDKDGHLRIFDEKHRLIFASGNSKR